MPLRPLSCLFLTAAALALVNGARAAETEPPPAIRAAVQATVAARLDSMKGTTPEIEVGEVDPRLQLPACPALEVSLPSATAAAMTAKVVCSAHAWTLYVPVHVHAWTQAVVAATNLAPNTTLTADSVSLARVDVLATNSAIITDPTEAEGKVLRTGVLAGAPILAPFLALPIVVHRGDKVLLTLKDSVMTIKATAVALEDGRPGQSILVQNPDSRKSLRATVADDGTVEVHL